MKHIKQYESIKDVLHINEWQYNGEYWKIKLDENIELYLDKIKLPKYSQIYNDITSLLNNPDYKNMNIYVWYCKDIDNEFTDNGWGYTVFSSLVKGQFKQYNGTVKLTKLDLIANKFNL